MHCKIIRSDRIKPVSTPCIAVQQLDGPLSLPTRQCSYAPPATVPADTQPEIANPRTSNSGCDITHRIPQASQSCGQSGLVTLKAIRKRGPDWAVETESEGGSRAAFGVSGTAFGPVAQDEGLCGRSRPATPPRPK